MIVGFHLHENVHRFTHVAVAVGACIEQPAVFERPFDHGGIVRIGAQDVFAIDVTVCVADHVEQRKRLRFTIDHPAGIEYLVTAVLRVCLGKHHQLDIRGIPIQITVGRHQVIDLVLGNRKAECMVRLQPVRRLPCASTGTVRSSPGAESSKTLASSVIFDQSLCHSIEQGALDASAPSRPSTNQRTPRSTRSTLIEPADPENIGGLTRPGGDGAESGQHRADLLTTGRRQPAPWPVVEQCLRPLEFRAIQRRSRV